MSKPYLPRAAILLALVALVALVPAAVPVAGQPAEGARTAPRVCVLPPADLSDDARAAAAPGAPGAPAGIGDAIAEIFGKRAAAAGLQVIERERWAAAAAGVPAGDLVRGPSAVRVAAGAGADLVVTGFYRREPAGRALLELKGYEVASGRIVAAVLEHTRSGLALYSATEKAADRLIAALGRPLPPPPARAERVQPGLARITLLSPDEGAAVFLAGEEPAGKVTGGTVTLAAPAGSSLDIELRKPGYHARRFTVGAEPEQTLPALAPETLWSAGLLLTTDRMIGAGVAARRYLAPDRLFAGAELFVSSPPSDDERGPGYRADVRLLLGGHAPADALALVRFGFAAGAGVQVLNLLDSGAPHLDPYVSAAVLGVELNLTGWTAFARAEARYSLDVADSSWGGTWQTWTLPGFSSWGLPPLTVGIVRKLR